MDDNEEISQDSLIIFHLSLFFYLQQIPCYSRETILIGTMCTELLAVFEAFVLSVPLQLTEDYESK